MHFSTYLMILGASWLVSVKAHSLPTAMFVNGKGVGDGTCMRMTKDATTNFVVDINSDAMTCGATGLPKVQRTCPVSAGDVVSFRWKRLPGSSESAVIVPSHNGPCATYMKQISSDDPAADGSFPDDTPVGDGWFKVAYDGQDSAGRWCIDRLRSTTNGTTSFKVPEDLPSGYYLIRPELLSIHQARYGTPQFYVGCAQVYITGGTGTAKPETVAIPGYVNMSLPAMNYNIYLPDGPFPGYGPPLYEANVDSVSSPSAVESSTTTHVAAPSPDLVQSPSSTSSIPISLSTFSTIVLPAPSTIDGPASQTLFSTSTTPCTHQETKRSGHVPRSTAVSRDATVDPFACPSGTIQEVGNLCLPEMSAWSDTDKSMPNCLAAQKRCYESSDLCHNQANAPVDNHSGHGCTIYEYKCNEIKKLCERKTMQAPTDLNSVLTEPRRNLADWGILM